MHTKFNYEKSNNILSMENVILSYKYVLFYCIYCRNSLIKSHTNKSTIMKRNLIVIYILIYIYFLYPSIIKNVQLKPYTTHTHHGRLLPKKVVKTPALIRWVPSIILRPEIVIALFSLIINPNYRQITEFRPKYRWCVW